MPVQWKQIFGEQSWNAIYKLLLRGSEHPQRINAASEKWYSLEPEEEVRRDESKTWTWKSLTAGVCKWTVWELSEKNRANESWLLKSRSEKVTANDKNGKESGHYKKQTNKQKVIIIFVSNYFWGSGSMSLIQ